MKNKKKILIVSLVAILIMLLCLSYAFFTYYKSTDAFILQTGEIHTKFENGNNTINLTYAYPLDDDYAIANLGKLGYIDFEVKGKISDENQTITYEIYLEEGENNTLDSEYIKVYLTDETNKKITEPEIYKYLDETTYKASANGKVLYQTSKKGEFSDKYRVYIWIDSNYSQNVVNQTFSFKVNLYAYNEDIKKTGSEVVKEAIASHETDTCIPSLIDNQEIVYLSGNNECVNFNYVWYSGKLWRITSINPDGTMKMVTENAIAGMYFGETTDYETSWVREFLNEDFLDTLYNPENILDMNAKWELTQNFGFEYHPTPNKTLQEAVGLLNNNDYYNSVIKSSFQTTFLNIGYNWWTSSPTDATVWKVDTNGELNGGYSPIFHAYGIRPAIVLRNDVLFKGMGTKDNPFTIVNDKKTGKVGERLNERVSGEYVKIDNKLFRIVGIENRITKLTSEDYVKDENGNILTKAYGDTSMDSFEEPLNSKNNNYWISYLNNIWPTKNLKKYLVNGTYYLGLTMIVDLDGSNARGSSYKGTICQDINTKDTTKNCQKTDRTWKGLVGLPRVGEMFSFPSGESGKNQNMFLITPYEYLVLATGVYNAEDCRITFAFYDSYNAAKPSINVNPDVVITSGTGTKDNPYEVELLS